MRLIDADALIDALHTWFRNGFDEDKWWNSTHVLAAIEGLPSAQQGYKWETCFECPLSHGCPKIKGCTNEQANEYASQIPNDCPLSAQPDHVADTGKKVADDDCVSRKAVIDAMGKAKWAKERLVELPSAQPERKKGQWLRCGEDGYPNNEDTVFWQCDQCLEQYTGRAKKIPNFCPNCGADMRKGEPNANN